MTTTDQLTKVNHDKNGNPRYVVHFLELINEEDKKQAEKLKNNSKSFKSVISYEYEIALKKAKEIGGKKFHNKQFGGGIVFQSYNTNNLINLINETRENK